MNQRKNQRSRANGYHRDRKCAGASPSGIQRESTPSSGGFTLIELLVVIAILALLIALLMPVLGQVRKHARAVVCQAKLRQWGVAFAAYTNDHDGQFYRWFPLAVPATPDNFGAWQWPYAMRPYFRDCNDLLLCPAASRKPVLPASATDMYAADLDGAWRTSAMLPPKRFSALWYFGSYALNGRIGSEPFRPNDGFSRDEMWARVVRNGGSVPVLIDSLNPYLWYPMETCEWGPPAYEGERPILYNSMNSACLNRHGGGVNAMFMDWSVRKVGVKELWVLKWHRVYNTAGHWTKAGGVTPEDWPAWMRKFKDY